MLHKNSALLLFIHIEMNEIPEWAKADPTKLVKKRLCISLVIRLVEPGTCCSLVHAARA